MSNQVQVFIIGDKNECSTSIQHSRKLFEPFQYQFDEFQTISDLIRNTFKFNNKLSVCVLYQNTFLDQDSNLARFNFHDQSVIYLLLIPSNSSTPNSTGSLKFYEIPELSQSDNSCYVRVTDCDIKTIHRNLTTTTTIQQIKRDALIQLKLTENLYESRMFYYGYELDNHMCPLSNDSIEIISQNKMPIIFDLVLTPLQSVELKSKKDLFTFHAIDTVIIEENPLLSLTSLNIGKQLSRIVTDKQRNLNKQNLVQFYGNFAFIVYIRLRIVATINQRSLIENFTDNLIYKYKNKETTQLKEALTNLFVFCDKDKSNELDENESTIALLIIFDYLNKNLKNDKYYLNYSSLIRIYYEYGQFKNECCYLEKDFECLLIDILTEHIRIHAFQSPIYFDFNETVKHNDLIQDFCQSIQHILTKQLKPTIENQYESPFTIQKIILSIGLFFLSIIFLPISSIIFYSKINKKKYFFIQIFVTILLSLVIYLIIINLILFHYFYEENIHWKVNSLEVYWPFALMIFFNLLIFYFIYGKYLRNQNEIDQKIFEQSQENAETQMLKHRAIITTKNRQKMTVHQFELTNKNMNLNENKNLFLKLKQKHFTIDKRESNGKQIGLIIAKIILLIFVFLITMIHPFIPMIYRNHFSNKTEFNSMKPFQIDMIKISYIVLSLPFYFLFIFMIIYSFYQYDHLYSQILQIFKRIANECDYTARKQDYYLNLKYRDNLDLFLCLIRNQYKKHDEPRNQIAYWTMISALILGLILAIVAFIRLLYYGFGGLNTLTSVFILIDVIILTILILLFLGGLVLINELTTKQLIQLLLRTKKEAFSDKFQNQWNIEYLSATSDYIKENDDLYTIKIFGFVIRKEHVIKIGLTLIGGVGTAFLSFVKKRLDIAE